MSPGRSRTRTEIVQSQSVLVSLLNRLGGRADAQPAQRDLVALAPVHLPLVEVCDHGPGGIAVHALNVEELMARSLGEETAAMELLATIVARGGTRAAAGGSGPETFWTARDRRTLARQALQWALDHPEAGLSGAAFGVARTALDEAPAGP